ncbi:MAG: DUF4097 family beta strand repeat-containing protein [Candidatus Krumholzibacteriota bacterium]|nr:DUF4097 family beta strand repeat-containing protein [Candidatus Krumholzibacteriota bacterium]
MRIYRTLFIFIFLVSVFVSSAPAYILRKDVRRSFEAGSSMKLRLKNRAGSVYLKGYKGDSLEINAAVKVRAPSKSKAIEIFREIVFDMSKKNKEISVETDLPRLRLSGLFSYRLGVRTSILIDYRILIPSGVNIEIFTSAGDIAAETLKDTFLLKTDVGDIDIRNSLCENGKAEVSRGEIRCELSAPEWKGKLDLRVGSGEIYLFLNEEISAVLTARSDKGRVELDIGDTVKPDIEEYDRAVVKFGSGQGRINLSNIRGKIIVESVK